jgi:hypothetical protein
MISKLKDLLKSKYSLPALVFVLSFVCYGLLAPWLKFFHDELSMLFFYQKVNDVGIFFEGNRPFLKYIYQPFLHLFGSNSLLWSLFSVFTRWLHAMSLYWLFKQIWPKKGLLAVTICLCAVVYPGFQAQFSSMIFGISFLIYSLFVLSLYFSIKTLSSPKHKQINLLISLFFSLVSLITSEYFFTLELVRYLLIWFYIRSSQKKPNLKKTLIASCPYLVLFFSTIIWRVLQENKETTYAIVLLNDLGSSFFPTLLKQTLSSLRDLWYTAGKVWVDSIFPSHLFYQQGQRIIFAYYGLILIIFVAIYFFLKSIANSRDEQPNTTENNSIWVFGIISLFLAGIPFWLAGLPINEKYFFTRWTIPFIIGSCILVPHSLFSIFKNKQGVFILISVLVAMGAGTQFLAANSFRHDWENQNKLYWELIWRIPALKENTVIFSDMLNFQYENSDELSSGVNFALMRKDQTSTIPYFWFYLPERLKTSILPELKEDIPIKGKRYYSLFTGNTSKALLIDFNPPGCLKILDPVLDSENPNLSSLTKQALFLSKPDLIIPNGTNLPDPRSLDIIGSEPKDNWCHYFEVADAASQFRDWNLIDRTYKDAMIKGYKPRDGREWFPFIEGLSHLSKWEEAATLTNHALKTTDNLEPMLCLLWKRISDNTLDTSQKQVLISKLMNGLECVNK